MSRDEINKRKKRIVKTAVETPAKKFVPIANVKIESPREYDVVKGTVKEVSPVTSIVPTLKTALIPEVVKAPGENEEVHRAMIRERVGLTYETLCKTVKDGLEAMVAILDSEGKIVNSVPSNVERAKFVQAAIDLLGAKKAEAGAQKIPSIIIVLPNGQRL